MQVIIRDKDAIPHVVNVSGILKTSYYKYKDDPYRIVISFIPDSNGRSDGQSIECDDLDHVRFIMNQLATASMEWQTLIKKRLDSME